MYPSLEGNKFHIFKAIKYIANKIQKCQSGGKFSATIIRWPQAVANFFGHQIPFPLTKCTFCLQSGIGTLAATR